MAALTFAVVIALLVVMRISERLDIGFFTLLMLAGLGTFVTTSLLGI